MVERDCVLCQTPESYQDLELARCEYWRVALNESSYYPGRCLIILNRHIQGGLVNTTDEEIVELRMITKSLELATQRIFGASHFNYADLENESRHAHWYFIPRYETPFVWGLVFHIDETPWKNYVPYPKEEKLMGWERKNAVVAMKQEFSGAWQKLFGENGHPLPEIVPNTDPDSQWIEKIRQRARDKGFIFTPSNPEAFCSGKGV